MTPKRKLRNQKVLLDLFLQESREEDEEFLFRQRLTETDAFSDAKRDDPVDGDKFSFWNDKTLHVDAVSRNGEE